MSPKHNVLSLYHLKDYLGASYHSVYEAGFSGLWGSLSIVRTGHPKHRDQSG